MRHIEFYRHPVDAGEAAISGRYGDWYEFGGAPGYRHWAVDYAVPWGTPTYSPSPGYVVRAGYWGSFGVVVVVALGGGGFSLLGHHSSVVVSPGVSVQTGALVGYAGSTGASTGPHVDWRVNDFPWFPGGKAGSYDPLSLLGVDMMSPEERRRLELLEGLFGGEEGVRSRQGFDWIQQILDTDRAVPWRIGQHAADGHGRPLSG